MRPDDIPAIRSLNLFKDMSEECFHTLIRGAYVQTFPAQVELITEGDPSDFLHIVVSGNIELHANWNGRETSMANVRPISTFILAATIKDGPYLMSARTAEKSRVIMIPSTDVRAIFEQDSEFARAVVTELAQCYRSLVKNTKNLKLRTSLERLANYILRTSNFSENALEFKLSQEKRRLASFLGMTPENLSRSIKALRPYGVEIDGNQVTITNIDDLKTIAKPSVFIDDFSS
ncbi:cyclic nucleotide-binding domain-containing protein [Aestuariibius sp. HNIBRBA575]|uniref:cyclic nucleotide-binding domain-containing protein n=1 Tax=Aestuariibius sp. HNIBRBA575 TaxID=3233343 RepID=UPI0034A53C98